MLVFLQHNSLHKELEYIWPVWFPDMMMSSNGNIFHVTDLCDGNPPVTGGFPSQRPVMQSFDVFFDAPEQTVEQTI